MTFVSAASPKALRLLAGRLSMRVAPRALLCCFLIVAACALLAVLSLTLGTLRLSLLDVARAIAGSAPQDIRLVVIEWRLPRVAGALLVGGALGMAGALFQTLLRNPLGSPDVIGFDAGAFTGAILAMLAGGGPAAIACAAFGGGVVAGLLVYAFAGPGRAAPAQLILIGIAVGAMFTAFNDWIIMTVRLDAAVAAASWKLGSLAGIDAGRLAVGAVILLVLLPLGLACGRIVRAMELGTEKARSLGTPLGPAQLRIALLGLALTAAATFLTGPIGFVALIAPQTARRLVGGGSLPLGASALFGAVFLLGSDLVARTMFTPRALPVGAVTACIGGLYFVLLLRARLTREAGR